MGASTWLLALVAGLALAAVAAAYLAYRRDMAKIRTRLAADSRIAETSMGAIEYARAGQGPPVLVIHGASGGYDQGLLIARENFRAGVHIIAPSRFGYLRTPFPRDASPAAQADAHAALLDALNLDRVIVLGFSAGGRSAIQLALRHKEKVSALILESMVLAAPFRLPDFNRFGMGRMLLKIVKAGVDFPYWLAIRVAPGVMIRFCGARMRIYAAASRSERDFLMAVMWGMLPLSTRLTGLANDAVNVSASWPLDKIVAPTLIVATGDDLFRTLPTARFMATQIPGAKLVTFETGSHMLVGHHEEIRAEVADFLASLKTAG